MAQSQEKSLQLSQQQSPSRANAISMLPCLFAGGTEAIRVEEEYEYQDRLGPKTRAVLNNHCAFKWSALDVLRYIGSKDMDPEDPKVDRKMARLILRMDIDRREPR